MTDEVILPEIIERTIANAFEQRRQSVRHGEAIFGQRGDSPIEWAMSIALEYAECVGMGEVEIAAPGGDWKAHYNNPEFSGTVVIPQATVSKYRAEFILVTGGEGVNAVVAIECDGHDYHERTKEQARHDRSRDRFFIENGIIVLRFTGSEIHANANACAEQALMSARSIWFSRYSLKGSSPE